MIDIDKYEGCLADMKGYDLMELAEGLLAEVKKLREENHTLEMMAWEYENVWDWLMWNTRLCEKLLLLIEEWKEEDGLVTIDGVTFRKEMIE